MKSHKYIGSILIAFLLLAGVADVVAQAPSKGQISGLNATERVLEFSAYVNGQVLHIDFDATVNTNYAVELYNLTGAKIGEWKIEKNSDKYCEVALDQPLRKGLYIIKVSTGQLVVAKKVQT